jgi:hypothetical protein
VEEGVSRSLGDQSERGIATDDGVKVVVVDVERLGDQGRLVVSRGDEELQSVSRYKIVRGGLTEEPFA